MRHRNLRILFVLVAACASPAWAQEIDVEELVLDNGMTFLLLPRDEQPNSIAAGWLAKVGSVNERPGITGISHFFEHMMFKGTTTIGTDDAAKDAEYRAEQQSVKKRINRLILTGQYERARRGEIDDPWDPANDTGEIRELRTRLRELMEQHKSVIIDNEFDHIYTNEGGANLNAFTTSDLTFYFIGLPANKFELWAWMESDRLDDSVFREFYAERDVVHEERRLRTESTPTGEFQEQFDAMFWQSSPYSWPVIGWPSDLNSYTLEQAQRYFETYYQPGNLVGVVVGDFEVAEIRPVIERYFGRLEPSGRPIPPVVTTESPQRAEKRMVAECDCQPQVEVRYHTVPFGHADSYALEMMAELLNGRTGRLYKTLVEQMGVASTVSASAGGFGQPAKYAGLFSVTAEVKGSADPTQLEQAWYGELARLRQETVPEREVQKVKNRVAADAFRSLQSNFFLMLQLGYYEALGGWEHINTRPRRLQAVTAEDIRRVANEYFAPENRSVAIYRRKAGAALADPDLLALDPVQRQQALMMLEQMKNYSLDGLREARRQLDGARTQVAPEQWDKVMPMVDYLKKKLDERIAELEALPAADNASD